MVARVMADTSKVRVALLDDRRVVHVAGVATAGEGARAFEALDQVRAALATLAIPEEQSEREG